MQFNEIGSPVRHGLHMWSDVQCSMQGCPRYGAVKVAGAGEHLDRLSSPRKFEVPAISQRPRPRSAGHVGSSAGVEAGPAVAEIS